MSFISNPIMGPSSGLLVLDKTPLFTIQEKLSGQFVSIQTKIIVASEFDILCCLDFIFYPKVIRTIQVLLSFQLQENVYERIKLHYESSLIIDEIWSQFNIVRFDKAYLTPPPLRLQTHPNCGF
eukprot:TRINITY_DN64_c1_g3_i1.p1 TRINITY_DN64_c1_g3~~TRINITY_DN64_c1_g3_i1.p1  ORF type:complete len:124 (-),score=1.21 TRINITY_DN64_c1_g3_i1:460-831(-)